MISNFSDYRESILFELYILETGLPNLSSYENTTIDVRSPDDVIRTLSCIVSMNDESINKLKISLTPLLFGAAWKIIDLLVELSLNQTDSKTNRKKWTIKEKQTAVLAGIKNNIFPTCNFEVWQAMLAAYAATVEYRHCLVHRQANIDEQGNLNVSDSVVA